MCNEDSVGSGQVEAEGACVDKVLGEASDLAPGVGCDASLVDTPGESFRSEYDLGTDGGNETGEANDSTGIV
jgi:hypothetical protein